MPPVALAVSVMSVLGHNEDGPVTVPLARAGTKVAVTGVEDAVQPDEASVIIT